MFAYNYFANHYISHCYQRREEQFQTLRRRTFRNTRRKKGALTSWIVLKMNPIFWTEHGVSHSKLSKSSKSKDREVEDACWFVSTLKLKDCRNMKIRWLLHHNNAPCRTANLINEFLTSRNIPVAPQPPY